MNLSSTEILVILVVALLVIGPKGLPDAAKTFAKTYREFRKVTGSIQKEINEVVGETTGMLTETTDTLMGKNSLGTTTGTSAESAPQVPPNRVYRPADELPDEDEESDIVAGSDTAAGADSPSEASPTASTAGPVTEEPASPPDQGTFS